MSRRFIAQLGENENLDEVFLVAEKQLRANRNGNLYLQVRLTDKTGSMIGMMWNSNDRVYASFETGDYLRVEGATQVYNGNLQVILNHVEKTVLEKVDEADFATLTTDDVDRLVAGVSRHLRALEDHHLRNLAECFLMDETFMAKYSTAPAGIKLHHAYKGGLIEHVISLMDLCASVGAHYGVVDTDLLVMGAFLHDVGKIDELSFERELSYSDAGQMIGHVVQGVGILDTKVREAEQLSGEPFPKELHLRLQHMIVSHHGQYEYGSPKLPMTLEAITLHFLDNLDSKIQSVTQIINEDANADSNWTSYNPALGRKLFKTIESEPRVE
ncbi:MAG: HD domain-containing protein [Pirellulaceae bacterium]|jgi:3'-5' exoribonuclease|nr:HD domain-containing protein [Pirellulaceae bacterium]HJN07201.1 HD domain-containing protein [Pirellulaceae bacterium]